ncbi:hypothetical protein DFO67_108186 [Modicisalibacter xianhensis]|uniref:Morphogenetic protein n=1 Tax=Modicisalibacter xianhensis TaxID=442341 RepID=A0A4R8FZP4_9GAMM|nr:hypothetical protein [Halomonas xianhensis]TDX29142.1 hypothetical protein DFO67_108186 [Halomonas xianhensis]
MKERPILFAGDMVRAILDGRKTQTRRIMKPQPEPTPDDYTGPAGHWWPSNEVQSMVHVERELQNLGGGWEGLAGTICPYGQPGDRLWVRETWQGPLVSEEEMDADPSWAKDMSRYKDASHCVYRASGDSCEFVDPDGDLVSRWRPSIHMPRWASRITLEIVSVRVERLQEISVEDARSEGVQAWIDSFKDGPIYHQNSQLDAYPVTAFSRLWQSINGDGSWDANPWVWVVEFKRIEEARAAA